MTEGLMASFERRTLLHGRLFERVASEAISGVAAMILQRGYCFDHDRAGHDRDR